MKPRRGPRKLPQRIHSSPEPEDYRRLVQLDRRDRSSISRLIELAVIEFLDESAPRKFDQDHADMRS